MLSGVVKGLVMNKSIQEAIKIGHLFAYHNLSVKEPTLKHKVKL